jgi:general secretion pathway protein E
MASSPGNEEKTVSPDLNKYQIQQEALHLLPAAIAMKYNVIPLAVSDRTLEVAMSDVHNIVAIQEMAAVTKMRIEPVQADAEKIRAAIERQYRAYKEIEQQLSGIEPEPPKEAVRIEEISDAPIVRGLDLIIREAVKVRASDIHIEPHLNKLSIRYRIDGVLYETMSLPVSTHLPLLSRLKVMANMDIANHKPQDGQITIKTKNEDIDIRVATINTVYGEMACLRLLDRSFAARALTELGFSPKNLEKYQQILKSPLGMILICGPTGSGKTTTLYASLNSLDKKSRKVITIEDPVEYRFEDITQVQANQRGGITFAGALRSITRHDPDVIMVGEIRDPDTAMMATQAALTGRLVLSSIHANDSIGLVFRLIDLGIEPFLISATLVCVVSQRMVRRVCPHCARPARTSPEAELSYQRETGEKTTMFLTGEGCNSCASTGYLGRIAISEVLALNQEFRTALMNNASADELRAIAGKAGMVSMWHDGMLKVKSGITTPSEVLRTIYVT